MGVILYEMLTGRVPFEGETVNEVLMKHLTSRPDVTRLPEPYQSIVSKALAKDPNHRLSRAFDLLPPEDAPGVPEVRIIGDGKSSSGAAASLKDEPAGRPAQDDVFRIEAEEPLFYIGPEKPPGRARDRRVMGERIRANWEALRRPRDHGCPSSRPPRRPGSLTGPCPRCRRYRWPGLPCSTGDEPANKADDGATAGTAAGGKRAGPYR